MYIFLILSVMLAVSLMSFFTSSVLSIMVSLVVIALLSTVLIGNLTNSWFAFILFLIYITGLLVLFSYMLAMTPNSFPSKVSLPSYSIVFPVVLFFCSGLKVYSIPEVSLSYEIQIVEMFSNSNMPIYWFMAIVLLVALVMVVNLTYKSAVPLRPYV